MNVSEYLLARLKELGVDHVFGIPGDFILPFFQAMSSSDIQHIAACNELNAGYAADGYARLKGLGVAAVTYGPGSFSIINAVAGAWAERVPLLVISGGPTVNDYHEQPVLHHLLPGRFDASQKIFEQVTAYTALLDEPALACDRIDEALRICLGEKRPVFLEIPSDVQTYPCAAPERFELQTAALDVAALNAAVDDIVARLSNGKRGVLIPGHEVHRQGLQDKVLALLEHSGLPAASMFVGKADYLEQHPQCVGAYQGAGSLEYVREQVEEADTVLFLGTVLSDFNLGGFTQNLTDEQVVSVLDDRVTSTNGHYEQVPLSALVDELLTRLPASPARVAAESGGAGFSHRRDQPYQADPGALMTNKRFYDRMAHFLRDGDIVASDAGCSINLTQLQFPRGATALSSCYWASIGMGFGAALGACFAAAPGQRVIAVEGDGSFQMSAQEFSSMARYACPAIVFVVNNQGYTAERLIHDGPFNDIADWRYHLLPAAWGGIGVDVHTEGDLEDALAQAKDHTGPGPMLIEIHVDRLDASEAFTLMSETLRSH